MTIAVGTSPAAPSAPQPGAPASGGSAPQSSGSQPEAGSQTPTAEQVEAQERTETAEQELTRLRAELETATATRIPDLQREIAAAQKEAGDAKKAEQVARGKALEVHNSWIEWARINLPPELWKQIEGHEAERTGKVLRTQADLADSYKVINEAWESGDSDFARFLTRQAAVSGRINRAALPDYRKMFDELGKPNGGKVQERPTTPPTSQAATNGQQPAPAAPKAPPSVPAPGGPAQPGGEPAYKPGDSPTSMWQRVFKGKGAPRPTAGS
jgi:hypothetical protein